MLMGQIQVELGAMAEARAFFLQAVEADKDRDAGAGGLGDDCVPDPDGDADGDVGAGAAEKFLWLAQLSDEGGRDSLAWYERGAAVLRRQMRALADGLAARPHSRDQQLGRLEGKKRKLAEALCAMAELHMTDLSWEAEAEPRCEALVTEATMLAPDLADTWQTVANVRISQGRTEDARAALERSLELWAGLPPEDPGVPAFPTRVSLLRLLIEVGREETAVDVADRLIAEDDTSVEVWYLGAFASFRLGERWKKEAQSKDKTDEWQTAWRLARKWLKRCLALFAAEDYEDERLAEHATELLGQLDEELGEAADGEDEEEVWEDEEGDGDEVMT